jgi:hypothetical protein
MVVTASVAVATFVLAEPLTLIHRLLFHGPLWCEHRSHHAHPNARRVVRNDLLWLWPLEHRWRLLADYSPPSKICSTAGVR